MTSAIDICNLALSNIRAGSINSLTEAGAQAFQCKLKYPILRDRCLREIPWQFNRKIRALSLLTTDVFGWAYTYSYPVDCLKITRLVGPQEAASQGAQYTSARYRDEFIMSQRDTRQPIAYEVFNLDDSKVLGANMPDLRIDFAAKVENPNLFSDDFVMALSHLLAAEIAVPLVGAEMGRALRGDSMKLYNRYMSSAVADDLNDRHLSPPESDFVTIRG